MEDIKATVYEAQESDREPCCAITEAGKLELK